MSTESFEKTIIINDDKAADVLIKGAEKPQRPRASQTSSVKIVSREVLARKSGKH